MEQERNNERLLRFAKSLRSNQTDAEKVLWSKLRAKRFFDIKFKRQDLVANYIVDFISYEKKIVIECDGGQHSEEKDRERTEKINCAGFMVVRYWNNDILANIDGVLEDLKIRLNICL